MFTKDNPPDSICLMRLSAIGDVCHTIPVIRTLQHHWPNAKLTWIIGKTEYSLMNGIPGIEFIIFDKSTGMSAYKNLKQQLAKRKFDLLLHAQEALRASIATLLVNAKIKLGYHRKDCQDFQWLFTNMQVDYQPRIHYMDRLLLFTEKLGLSPVIQWDIPIANKDKQHVDTILSSSDSYIVISPCSSVRKNNWRNWSAEKYAQIAKIITNEYQRQVVITGGPSEQELEYARYIEQHCDRPVINLTGKLNLKQLLYVLQNAEAVIAPDSGPTHMANAVGTPAIALFATSNPEFTGPYFNRSWIVNRYPDALEKFYHLSVDKAPWGKRVRHPEAMDMISVADVRSKLDLLGSQQ